VFHERRDEQLARRPADVEHQRMGDLAEDTAIEGSDGRYRARLSRDWEIWGPNGGYLAAIALRAAGAATSLPRPASFACHYLSVAEFDAVELTVTPLRQGKRAASLRVSMTQRERAILEAIIWVVGEVNGLDHDELRMPHVPLPGQLRSVEELIESEGGSAHAFWTNIERRPIRWASSAKWKKGPARFESWMRLRPRACFDDAFLDAARSLLLIDTILWPAAWIVHGPECPFIAPNLDVYASFHHPAPRAEWLFAEATSPVATGGTVGGQARVWSTDGRLLASGGGQLLCRPVPAGMG
jgi:acyl-CoA thioesterase